MKLFNGLRAVIVATLLILVCAGAAAAAPASTPPVSASRAGYVYYRVQPGDNLYRISLRYGVTVYAIMSANGIGNANAIYIGQVLRIPTGPVSPPPAPAPSNGFYYTVVRGDTMAIIAARFGSTVYAIMQANGMTNANFIYPGQALWIPGAYRPPQPAPGSWRGEYFNNERLAGAPSVVRNDGTINFDWGLGWPSPRINADYFSVRWTRTFFFYTGTWRFTTTTDDGVRLFVDNVLVIDQWHEQPATSYSADVPLGAGNHTVRMEYFELTGVALARLNWQLISPFPAPCSWCPPPFPSPVPPSGAWQGEYFDNMFLQGGPDLVRTDPAINFNWGNGSPAPGISRSLWSARWTQVVNFSRGTYRFHAVVDDGVRLFVDDRVVIDEWEDNAGTEFIGDRYLNSGNHTVRVEYYQKGHEASLRVWWEKLN